MTFRQTLFVCILIIAIMDTQIISTIVATIFGILSGTLNFAFRLSGDSMEAVSIEVTQIEPIVSEVARTGETVNAADTVVGTVVDAITDTAQIVQTETDIGTLWRFVRALIG